MKQNDNADLGKYEWFDFPNNLKNVIVFNIFGETKMAPPPGALWAPPARPEERVFCLIDRTQTPVFQNIWKTMPLHNFQNQHYDFVKIAIIQ